MKGEKKLMRNRFTQLFFAFVALVASVASSFGAEPWDSIETALTTATTEVGGLVAAVVGIAVIFLGIKLGKRLMNKA
jgi:TrbC/VIRB2 pilin